MICIYNDDIASQLKQIRESLELVNTKSVEAQNEIIKISVAKLQVIEELLDYSVEPKCISTED